MARKARKQITWLTRRPTATPGPPTVRPTGWLPLPTMGPAPLQIGVYGDRLLSQFPARIDGVQLHQGVEGMRSNWYTPTVSAVPTFAQTQQNQRPIAGGQRYGQTYTGPTGPISARKMQAAVVAAQVRQSGLSAMQWAQGLTGK